MVSFLHVVFPPVSCGLSSMPALSMAFLLLFPRSDAAAPRITSPQWQKQCPDGIKAELKPLPLCLHLTFKCQVYLHPHYNQQVKTVYIAQWSQKHAYKRPVVPQPLWLFLLLCVQLHFGHFGYIIVRFLKPFLYPYYFITAPAAAYVLQTQLSTLFWECRVRLSRSLAAPNFLPETDLGCWFKSSTDVCLTVVYYTINITPLNVSQQAFPLAYLDSEFIYSRDEHHYNQLNFKSIFITFWLLCICCCSSHFHFFCGWRTRMCVCG